MLRCPRRYHTNTYAAEQGAQRGRQVDARDAQRATQAAACMGWRGTGDVAPGEQKPLGTT